MKAWRNGEGGFGMMSLQEGGGTLAVGSRIDVGGEGGGGVVVVVVGAGEREND